MKNKKLFGAIVSLALVVTAIPTLAFAATQTQHFGEFTLSGTQLAKMNFTADQVYQNYNFTMYTVGHDGGQGDCTWCTMTMEGKKKNWIGQYKTLAGGMTTYNTPKAGYYEGKNLGNVGTGDFRYVIKDDNILKATGILRVNEQDYN